LTLILPHFANVSNLRESLYVKKSIRLRVHLSRKTVAKTCQFLICCLWSRKYNMTTMIQGGCQ